MDSFKTYLNDRNADRFDDFLKKLRSAENLPGYDQRESGRNSGSDLESASSDSTLMVNKAQQCDDNDLIVELKFKDCLIRELHESNHSLRLRHAEAENRIAQLRVKNDVHCECCSRVVGDEEAKRNKFDHMSSMSSSSNRKIVQNRRFSYFPKMSEQSLDPFAKVKVWQEANESSVVSPPKFLQLSTFGDFEQNPTAWNSISSSSPRTNTSPPRPKSLNFGIAGDFVSSSNSTPKSITVDRGCSPDDEHLLPVLKFSESRLDKLSHVGKEDNFCPIGEQVYSYSSEGLLLPSSNCKSLPESWSFGAINRPSDGSLTSIYYSNSSDMEPTSSFSIGLKMARPGDKLQLAEFDSPVDRQETSSPGIVGAILKRFANQSF